MEKKFVLISCSYSFLRVCCCSFSGLCGCVFRAGGYGAIHHQQGPVTRARGPFAQQSRPFSTVGKSHITTSTTTATLFLFVSFRTFLAPMSLSMSECLVTLGLLKMNQSKCYKIKKYDVISQFKEFLFLKIFLTSCGKSLIVIHGWYD